jgi:hypothetical protein
MNYKSTITLGAAALMASLFSLDSAVAGGTKPIAGVNCNGGFFVKSPDRHIHWIDQAAKTRTEVYSQKDEIYAMAQCGAGVISVFKSIQSGEETHSAYYSPNCMNIGSEAGDSVKIYRGKAKINRIDNSDGKLELRLVGNTYLRGDSCASVVSGS